MTKQQQPAPQRRITPAHDAPQATPTTATATAGRRGLAEVLARIALRISAKP